MLFNKTYVYKKNTKLLMLTKWQNLANVFYYP